MVLDYCIERQRPFRVYCADTRTFQRLGKQGVDVIASSDWGTDGKIAGPLRNRELISAADRLLLFNGGGPGSKSVKKLAKLKGIDVEEWIIDPRAITTRDTLDGTIVAVSTGGSTFI